MRKFITRFILVVILLVILAFVGVGLFLDGIIKRAVETFGPKLTNVEVTLHSVSLSLFSGSGKIQGLQVGNPQGYKTPWAIRVGNASLTLQPGSLLSDKVVIKSINVQAPEITFETDLKNNNLSKILANVQAATGGAQAGATTNEPAPSQPAKPAKKLQVDEFVLRGGKVHVSVSTLGGRTASVALPDIRLTDLGRGPEGITAAELTQRVLEEIQRGAAQAAGSAVADLSKGALYITKDVGGTASTNALEKATRSIGDFFKKK